MPKKRETASGCAFMINFGEKLRELRKQKHMTQQILGDRLGVTKAMISAYEQGMRYPSYDVLIGIANIFGVTTDYLLGRIDEKTVSVDDLSDSQAEIIMQMISEFRESNEHTARRRIKTESPRKYSSADREAKNVLIAMKELTDEEIKLAGKTKKSKK